MTAARPVPNAARIGMALARRRFGEKFAERLGERPGRNLAPLAAPALVLTLAIALSLTTTARADTPQQRGWMVYQQVCSACHGLQSLHYGDVLDLGIPPDTARDWAADHDMPDGVDDTGAPKTRHARLSDPVLSPYANDTLARAANHGALPPDMSRMALTMRGGPEQIRRILLSYGTPPPGTHLDEGRYYNTALRWKHIAMPPPLQNGMLTYPDGTAASVGQMATDVSAFLDWCAHPHEGERRHAGAYVMGYLALMSVLTFLLQRRIWTARRTARSEAGPDTSQE